MVDVVTVGAIALLVGGVLGTLVPLVPGGLLSVAGVGGYWWASGFTEPGPVWVTVFVTLGVLTLVVELFGSAIAARGGGASWGTTLAAAIVGLVLMVVSGPLGLLVGLFGTVLVLELVRARSLDVRSATYATVGVLASTAVQVILTATILVGFLLVVFVL